MRTLVCTSALLVFLIANLPGSKAQCGGSCGPGFQASCPVIFAVGTNGVFSAECKTKNGDFVYASINLDNYISNANGNLVKGAGFLHSCENPSWQAQCRSVLNPC